MGVVRTVNVANLIRIRSVMPERALADKDIQEARAILRHALKIPIAKSTVMSFLLVVTTVANAVITILTSVQGVLVSIPKEAADRRVGVLQISYVKSMAMLVPCV